MSMNKPLLNLDDLTFRPYEEGMEGWFLYRPKSERLLLPEIVHIILVSGFFDQKETGAIVRFVSGRRIDIYKREPVEGEFAGPIL